MTPDERIYLRDYINEREAFRDAVKTLARITCREPDPRAIEVMLEVVDQAIDDAYFDLIEGREPD